MSKWTTYTPHVARDGVKTRQIRHTLNVLRVQRTCTKNPWTTCLRAYHAILSQRHWAPAVALVYLIVSVTRDTRGRWDAWTDAISVRSTTGRTKAVMRTVRNALSDISRTNSGLPIRGIAGSLHLVVARRLAALRPLARQAQAQVHQAHPRARQAQALVRRLVLLAAARRRRPAAAAAVALRRAAHRHRALLPTHHRELNNMYVCMSVCTIYICMYVYIQLVIKLFLPLIIVSYICMYMCVYICVYVCGAGSSSSSSSSSSHSSS